MRLLLVPILAALALTPAFAQQQPDNSRPASLNPGPTKQEKSGTTVTGNGATGWGGTDQEKPAGAQTTKPSASATSSELASGVDLNGPPQKFEGSATPE
jgi:hypothetical protein